MSNLTFLHLDSGLRISSLKLTQQWRTKGGQHSYIGAVVKQELCTSVMTAETSLVERRDSVHGESVCMKTLQGKREDNAVRFGFYSNTRHVYVTYSMYSMKKNKKQERLGLILPERGGSSSGAVCPGRLLHGEEFCPTRNLRQTK